MREEYFLMEDEMTGKKKEKALDEMSSKELLDEIERLSDLMGYEDDEVVYARLYDRYDTAIRLRGAA